MPSEALRRWRTERAERLAVLADAHVLVGGAGHEGRWRAEQLNAALVLRLAAEFQDFARELHNQAAATAASWASGGNRAIERLLKVGLTTGRQLDRRNAHPDALGEDFGRFDFDVWSALRERDPATATRQAHLARLNEVRNAIAHDDEARLGALRAAGFPVSLPTIERWREALDGLATTLDAGVSIILGECFGRPGPW